MTSEWLSPYSRPGIGIFDKELIIDMITYAFEFDGNWWVLSKCRDTHEKVARQLLMTCLMDHAGFRCKTAARVCGQTHANALHAKKIIHETYMHDSEYGRLVNEIYDRCRREGKLITLPSEI